MDCVVVRLLALHAYVLWRESRIEFILFSLVCKSRIQFNPLNAELNPICHLLALLGGPTIVIVSRLRVNTKTWMIYGFFSKLCVCRSVRERKRERERESKPEDRHRLRECEPRRDIPFQDSSSFSCLSFSYDNKFQNPFS